MIRQIIPAIAIIFLLGSCSSLKPLNFISTKQVASLPAASSPVKFIDEISLTQQTSITNIESKEKFSTRGISTDESEVKNEQKTIDEIIASRTSFNIENASVLQRKYALLLNAEVEQLQNAPLLEGIDDWYGTRYRMGGTTKKGVDCSAFVVAIFSTVYGVTLPRTARYQYRVSRRISRTELQEGDLLFFNTRGGVSHVGIYLQNNKFVHASATKGVTISDMFDPYYLKRFIGAGRVENKQLSTAALNP